MDLDPAEVAEVQKYARSRGLNPDVALALVRAHPELVYWADVTALLDANAPGASSAAATAATPVPTSTPTAAVMPPAPVAATPVPAAPTVPPTGALAAPTFVYPIAGGRIYPLTTLNHGEQKVTEGYNAAYAPKDHQGVDIGAPSGSVVVSPVKGRILVLHAGTPGELYGNTIVVQGADGTTYRMAHLQQQDFGAARKQGDSVEAGDHLGLVGSSGNATGPHLHFEVHGPVPNAAAYEVRGERAPTFGPNLDPEPLLKGAPMSGSPAPPPGPPLAADALAALQSQYKAAETKHVAHAAAADAARHELAGLQQKIGNQEQLVGTEGVRYAQLTGNGGGSLSDLQAQERESFDNVSQLAGRLVTAGKPPTPIVLHRRDGSVLTLNPVTGALTPVQGPQPQQASGALVNAQAREAAGLYAKQADHYRAQAAQIDADRLIKAQSYDTQRGALLDRLSKGFAAGTITQPDAAKQLSDFEALWLSAKDKWDQTIKMAQEREKQTGYQYDPLTAQPIMGPDGQPALTVEEQHKRETERLAKETEATRQSTERRGVASLVDELTTNQQLGASLRMGGPTDVTRKAPDLTSTVPGQPGQGLAERLLARLGLSMGANGLLAGAGATVPPAAAAPTPPSGPGPTPDATIPVPGAAPLPVGAAAAAAPAVPVENGVPASYGPPQTAEDLGFGMAQNWETDPTGARTRRIDNPYSIPQAYAPAA